jgi:hypothetical protein
MGNEDGGGDWGGENGDIAGLRVQEGNGWGLAWGGGGGGAWSRLVSEIHGQWRVSNGSCGSLRGRICVCVCVCVCINILPDTHTHTHTHTHT